MIPISLILLITALVFIAVDVLMGLKRGLFPALFRLVIVFLCAVIAFSLASKVSDILGNLTVSDGKNLQQVFEEYLSSQGTLDEALSKSGDLYRLVLGLPTVILAELSFVVLFFVLRLISLPISAIISHFLFRFLFGRKRKNGQSLLPKTHRGFGMIVGAVQALICFSILMVPVYGVIEFGETFTSEFSDVGIADLEDVSSDIQSEVLDPFNNCPVVKVGGAIGQRNICLGLFHNLSSITIEEREIDYFKEIEDLFPAIAAVCKLNDVDPNNMTDADYENICTILQTAKDHPEVVEAVTSSVSDVVSQYVDDSYRDSADTLVSVFTDKVVSAENAIEAEALKTEIETMRKTLEVVQNAASTETKDVFDAETTAKSVIDDIVKTDLMYDSLLEISKDSEKSETLRGDFHLSDDKVASTKQELENYRAECLTESAATRDKKLEITDALADVLGVVLS